MTLSRCPAIGCEMPTNPGMFMCRPHWFGLPKPIRDRVYQCWRAYLRDRQSEQLIDHAEICDEAIRFTAEKEGRAPPGPADQRAARLRLRLLADMRAERGAAS